MGFFLFRIRIVKEEIKHAIFEYMVNRAKDKYCAAFTQWRYQNDKSDK